MLHLDTSEQTSHAGCFLQASIFNERVCMDTFYVWDAQSLKKAVTHLVDAFSLYQVAIVSKDPLASTTTRLDRDRWIRTFGPPTTLMTDGGSEFNGTLESVLRTFQVYHDIVPPTAHWAHGIGRATWGCPEVDDHEDCQREDRDGTGGDVSCDLRPLRNYPECRVLPPCIWPRESNALHHLTDPMARH